MLFSITGVKLIRAEDWLLRTIQGSRGELGSKPVQLEEGINEYVVNDINEWTRVGLLKESSWGYRETPVQ